VLSIGRLTGKSKFLWVGDIVPEICVELVRVQSAVKNKQCDLGSAVIFDLLSLYPRTDQRCQKRSPYDTEARQ